MNNPRLWVEVLVWALLMALVFLLFARAKTRSTNAPATLRFALWASVALWTGFHGPLRTLVATLIDDSRGVLAVVPSFFAGCAVSIGVSLEGNRPAVACALFGSAFVLLTEVIQLWISSVYTFDPWDIAAGTAGALLAVPVILWAPRGRYSAKR